MACRHHTVARMQGIFKLCAQRRSELGSLALRAYGSAAKEVAHHGENAFLRFSNPYPQNLDYSPLLSSIPETKVRIPSPTLPTLLPWSRNPRQTV